MTNQKAIAVSDYMYPNKTFMDGYTKKIMAILRVNIGETDEFVFVVCIGIER